VDEETLNQTVKGDPQLMNIVLQKKMTNMKKDLEMMEQKARSVTLQW
jgi:hypothetical protein